MKTFISKFVKAARHHLDMAPTYAWVAYVWIAGWPGLAIGRYGRDAAGLTAAYLAYTNFGSILGALAAFVAAKVAIAPAIDHLMFAWFFTFTPKRLWLRAQAKIKYGF